MSLKKKTTQHLFFIYFQIASKYSNSFMTAPLNIIFDDFGTCIKYDYL